MSTLEEVYAFAAPRRALGVEAALWSEYLRTDSDLWYALLPRTIALSAVANNRERKQPWRTFRDRTLPAELHWLADNGYTFRVPNTLFTIRESDVRYASVAGNPNAAIAFTAADRVKVVARSLVPGAAIRYRIGAQTKWRTYADPFEAAAGARVDAQTVAPGGRSGAVSSVFIRRSAQPRGSRAFDDVVSP